MTGAPGQGHPRAALALASLLAAAIAAGFALPARAIELPVPQGAVQTDGRDSDPDSALIATAPFAEGWSPVAAEGKLSIRAWRLPGRGHTSLALIEPYRAELKAAGYDILLDCGTNACGGFDFRYELPVLPEPGMHVDLGDFRYLSARLGTGDAAEYVAVLASRSNDQGFVQILTLTPSQAAAVAMTPAGTAGAGPSGAPAPSAEAAEGGLIAQLTGEGHAALDDLDFTSGSAELRPGSYGSLAALGAWLSATPGARITLVGHTDAQGSLSANIALSRARAQSVAERLVADFGAPGDRIAAEGAGYLAPRASNLTDEGRRKNRRVEVILTPTR